MKQILFFCIFVFSFSFLCAQTYFGYDASGHRTQRTIFLSSPSSAPSYAPSVVEDRDDEDVLLADENDVFEADNNSDESDLGHPQTPEKIYTDKLKESDILIYPNPTKGALAVEIRNKNPQISHQLTVHNLNGSMVFQQSHVNAYTPIDLSSQPKGVYLLRISSQDSVVTWKIIKE